MRLWIGRREEKRDLEVEMKTKDLLRYRCMGSIKYKNLTFWNSFLKTKLE